jgi:thiamine biosynthesis lipoprotein
MLPVARRRFLQIGLGVGGLGVWSAIAKSSRRDFHTEVHRRGRALGTTVELRLLHESSKKGEAALDAAFAAIEQVEEVMSLYRPQSRLSELNRIGALDDPHPWLMHVLQHAQALSRTTDGAFDVTMQPLWQCWSQAAREERMPTEAEVYAACRLVDWRSLHVSSQRIELQRPGMQITLNGIAQGFAADQAAAALRSCGVVHALINTGEVQALGRKRDEAWTVGIQHPRHADAYSALVSLNNRALSTSGDYATSFSPDKRHHHIIDPRVGYSPTELASVTILAGSALEADALSTAVLVLGADHGLKLIAARNDVDALFVFKDGRTFATPGFPEEAAS